MDQTYPNKEIPLILHYNMLHACVAPTLIPFKMTRNDMRWMEGKSQEGPRCYMDPVSK